MTRWVLTKNYAQSVNGSNRHILHTKLSQSGIILFAISEQQNIRINRLSDAHQYLCTNKNIEINAAMQPNNKLMC